MLAGQGEAFRLRDALHDGHGIRTDLLEHLRMARPEFLGGEVGLVVLRAGAAGLSSASARWQA